MTLRASRRREAGRGTGCVAVILVCIALLCAGAFIGGRVTAAPSLGGVVRGPSHGDDPGTIAARAATSITQQLQTRPHAVFVLSEHDLTVIAAYRNPDPETFTNPEVRVRNAQILLSAQTKVGPLTSVAVAHITLQLSGAPTDQHLDPVIVELDLGRMGVPDFMRPAFDPRGNGALAIDPVFNDSQALEQLRDSVECVVVADDGVHVGFHRGGVTPNPNVCVGAA